LPLHWPGSWGMPSGRKRGLSSWCLWSKVLFASPCGSPCVCLNTTSDWDPFTDISICGLHMGPWA
jgi:hypothetical protein